MNSLRPLLLILAWLLALLPAEALALIPQRENLPPALPLLRIAPAAEDDGDALTLHLDGLHDRAGPCRRVLVRQNPWSAFDPKGLAGKDPAKMYKAAKGIALKGEKFAGKKVTSEMLENGPKLDALKNYEKIHGKVTVSYSDAGELNLSAHKIADANIGTFSREANGSGSDINAAWSQLKSGKTKSQFTKAEIAELETTHTWHHTGTDGALELVPRVINDAFPHTGGAAMSRAGVWGKNALAGGTALVTFVSSTADAAMGDDPSAGNIASGLAQDVIKPVGVIKGAIDGVLSLGRTMMQSLENMAYGEPGENDPYEKYRTK